MKKYFTLKEWMYYFVWRVFGLLSTPPRLVSDWAVKRLNESYYRDL
jgi:hypothetical protein